MKPVVTGGEWHDENLIGEDALYIAHITGQIVRQAQQLQSGQNLLPIEAAGDWYAPNSERETRVDLACAPYAPIVLVVELRLGRLNHTLLP